MKKPYTPKQLPIEMSSKDIIDIYKLETIAMARIEKFNTILDRSVIKNNLLILFSLDESIQSTRIEGTQATFAQVVDAQISGEKNKDIQEVLNYLEAINKGNELLSSLPISTRLLHTIHKIILRDARGQSSSPGSFRKAQNFIGRTRRIEDATYIPPEPNRIEGLISNLEKYINDEIEDDFSALSRAAIVHAQFETIHPYLDGNGRVGRILIILYLLSKGVISSPTFFLSEELEKNKQRYYALLNGLRNDNPQWKEWLLFFVNSAIKQAESYIAKLEKIEELYEELSRISKNNGIRNEFVMAIFKNPSFTIKKMMEETGFSYNTAKKYVEKLQEARKIYGDDKSRNKVYRFYELYDILS